MMLVPFKDKQKKGHTINGCPLQKGGNTRKPYDIRLSSIPFFYTVVKIKTDYFTK